MTKSGSKPILHDLSGVFRPGTMTLVLGPPGSGKSALLKLLSGRFTRAKHFTIDGEVTYNGLDRVTVTKQLPQLVTYVSQHDSHCSTLTVRETLEFAHECCGGQLHVHDKEKASQPSPSLVIQQLGLEACQDTVVGDEMTRGVSGGERKRVTTGEMAFGHRRVVLLDEISTGLDSAATFDIIKGQRATATTLGMTVIIALLQPPPEVFALFDNVLLLNQGRTVFHGPCDQVLPYFESLGLRCPPDRDVADFLLDLATHRQQQYQHSTVESPYTASQFADAFALSSIHHEMVEALEKPHDPATVREMKHQVQTMPAFHQSFWASTWTLMKRQAKMTRRNSTIIRGRVIMITVVGVVYATLFFQFDPSDVQLVMSTLYGAMLFLAMGHSSQTPTYLADREVFYKQRDAHYFRTASYILSNSASQLPMAFAETLVFGTMVYWICGFVASFGSFVVFVAMLFMMKLAFAAWFFFLSSIAPNVHLAEPFGLVSVLFYNLFSGYLVTKDLLPSFFQWAYWANPVAWGLRSLAINQYGAEEFDVCVYKDVNYCEQYNQTMGEHALHIYQLDTKESWVGYGFVFLLGTYAVCMTLATLALEYIRYEHSTPSSQDTAHDPVDKTVAMTDEDSAFQLVQSPRVNASVQMNVSHSRVVTPVTLAFQDLWYSVPHPKNPSETLDLLKGVSGYALPGSMTALMGSSGAGKTTLLDVIARRKTSGKMQGKVFLNGHEATDLVMRRVTGYCEQMDIHSTAATIYEALVFSAYLRQSQGVSEADKLATVDECLDLMELRAIASQRIEHCSIEQRKRLTIAVELVAQPSVLFLDEPTTGLDACAAKMVMEGVRKVANTGRTVVCTIHQPSWEVFQLFDRLLLLQRGGKTVFFGDVGSNAVKVVQYFESIAGVTPMETDANPATWMLDVIGAGLDKTITIDFPSVFQASPLYSQSKTELLRPGVSLPAVDVPALTFTTKFAASEWTQFKLVLLRCTRLYERTLSYTVTRVVVYAVLAVIFGVVFIGLDYTTYQGVNAGVGILFITSCFIGVVGLESGLPLIFQERTVMYRERAAQTYHPRWHFIAAFLVEIPYVLVSTLVFCGIFFPLANFPGGFSTFVIYWLYSSFNVFIQVILGQAVALSLTGLEAALLVALFFNVLCFLLMGYTPPAWTLPAGYKWLHYVIPYKYVVNLLAGTVFGGDFGEQAVRDPLPPALGLPSHATIQQYMHRVYLVDSDQQTLSMGLLSAYLVGFVLLSLVAVRFINHQHR
ncbi:hypothetical protein Poli38472_013090 [Pythium oligandrum]|uniref:ABC transporter domain-containing protein n=1 Tax=Pythium oligandrum TaxID=41045 RepID=A0A8K1FBV3_PYTOL|nr:hypothetical protein Poli38472_013090 [Pythium oligandrum]|eukprot:TMW55199.1 hypothetical protein Poli38472_013090 [Pythium oligandrum]